MFVYVRDFYTLETKVIIDNDFVRHFFKDLMYIHNNMTSLMGHRVFIIQQNMGRLVFVRFLGEFEEILKLTYL